MKTHTPTSEMFADYASGAASPGIALLVSAHLTHAPESRGRVAMFEALGGALLAGDEAEPVGDDALDRALNALDDDTGSERAQRRFEPGPLPRAVADAVGLDFGDIPWRFRLPGVAEHEISADDGERISLLRAKPGARIPQHTHEGTELTLILAGAMEDGGEIYRPGELAINTDDDDHKPTIVGDETCYCLVVMDGRMRFTGTFSRALNIFGE